MTSEQAQELDLHDKKKGVVMHQKGFLGPEEDKIWRACRQEELKHVLELRQEQEPDLSTPSLQELEEWKQIGLLPPGKGGRAVTVRDCGEMKLHHVGKDTFDFEQKLLREINEGDQ